MFNICNYFKKKEENIKNEIDDYIILNRGFENNECIICLEYMIKGDKIKILECGHIYHYKCINDWFKKKKEINCPLCSN